MKLFIQKYAIEIIITLIILLMGMTGYLIDNTRPRKITIGEKQYTEHEVLTAIIINQKDLFVVLGQIPE